MANALDRHSKLAGDGRIQNGNVDREIYIKTCKKMTSIHTPIVRNCNVLTDSVTEQFRHQIIDHLLANDFLADYGMIKSERSMFNLDVGVPVNDLDTIVSKININLSESQRKLHVRVLSDRLSAYSDILLPQAVKVPPIRD